MPILRKELSAVVVPKEVLLDDNLDAEAKAVYAIMQAIPGWASMEDSDLTAAIADSTWGLRQVDVNLALSTLMAHGYVSEVDDENT